MITPSTSDRLVSTILTLQQYPTLSGRIRHKMRKRLYLQGVVTQDNFEGEVRQQALESQKREGIKDPLTEEATDTWQQRICSLRDHLTDSYFSLHFSYKDLDDIIHEVLQEKGVEPPEALLSINPELAPLELTLQQAKTIEQMPVEERVKLEARLSELKVVLIRNLISDQLRYINIAKGWFTAEDLANVRRHKIGTGRIGGKAAGMLLAYRIIQRVEDDPLRMNVRTPETYFLGSDIFYDFMERNNLVHWNDQKYKKETEMRSEYPLILADFERGSFATEVLDRLVAMLQKVEGQPLIVRSSSLLEDNFGTSFAGKYDSWFCANQSTPDNNLQDLVKAIARVYASTLNPNALLYRRSKGLQDYDERMAILIQVVEGQQSGNYYFPTAAGVAFSRNLYRWAPQIRREDGFIRLVWGLGTRAVDRVGNDYPRLVALSHPLLRPNSSPQVIRKYSQQYIDVIDIKENILKTVHRGDVLQSDYEDLRFVAQQDQEDYFSSLRSNILEGDPSTLCVTMEEFLKRTPFAERMKKILHTLEKQYQAPVDLEFTARVTSREAIKPDVEITILQCRPQSQLGLAARTSIPVNIDPADIVFSTNFMVPDGLIPDIQYILFVPPEAYYALATPALRSELGRTISKMNDLLAKETFICVGPGRWGTSNPDLGVHIDYGDIYNSRALVELTGQGFGHAPEPSLGTHFFQDLLESQIYPLAINLDDDRSILNRAFFYDSPNHLLSFLPEEERVENCLRVIKVSDFRKESRLTLAMDDEKSKAAAYFTMDSLSV